MGGNTMKRSTKQLLSALLVVAMMLSLLVVMPAAAASDLKTYIFDAVTETLTDFNESLDGVQVDPSKEHNLGTDGFFTFVPSSDKAKTGLQDNDDKSMQEFADGYTATQRWTFDCKSTSTKAFIKFTTGDEPAELKVWWISGGDDRQLTVYEGAAMGDTITYTSTVSKKNTPYITPKIELKANTTYFVCSATTTDSTKSGTIYFCKLQVKEIEPYSVYTLDVDAESTLLAVGKTGTDLENVVIDKFYTFGKNDKLAIKNQTDDDGNLVASEFTDGSTHTNYIDFGGTLLNKAGSRDLTFTMAERGGVKVWWRCSDKDRPLVIESADGQTTYYTSANAAKDGCYVDTLNLDAGSYRISGNKPHIYKIEATPGKAAVIPVNATWDETTIGKPTISVALNAKDSGSIDVSVTGVNIGTAETDESATTYAEKVVVYMMDETGTVVDSAEINARTTPSATKTVSLTPDASGSYTFVAKAVRGDDETPIASEESSTFAFTLPLAKAAIKSATSKGAGADGAGTVEVVWAEVPEATGYNVYNGETKVNTETVTGLSYTITGLTVGDKISVAVEALRGSDVGPKGDAVTVTVTAEEQRVWSFTNYGESSSAKAEENGYSGSVADNDLKVWSTNGKGKITDKADGVCFYYTAIPEAYNWTLTGRIHVDSWTWSNGQEGFGILATDTLGSRDGEASVYNNNYMLAATKSDDKNVKMTGYLGLTFIEETGYTNEWLAEQKAAGVTTIVPPNGSTHHNMDAIAEAAEIIENYNIVANCTNAAANTKTTSIEKLSGGDYKEQEYFIFTLQRNNTGYYATFTSDDGQFTKTVKTYDPNALSVQDTDNVYVGFFTARNATISVTDVKLTTIAKEDDAPAEEPDPVYVEPKITIASPDYANSDTYNLILTSNVKGDATIKVGSTTYTAELKVQGTETADAKSGLRRADVTLKLKSGDNNVNVTFVPKPAEEQDFGNTYTFLADTAAVATKASVRYNTDFANQTNLYVAPAPTGNAYNKGTKTSPLDIYTATQAARPGQKIIITEGTYKLISTVTIGEGIDGTADNPIYLIADPEATSRPVFDFQGKCVGINFSGDYWYCKGFDVTNSEEGEEGIAVAGKHNVFEQVDTYKNRGSGMQISRISGYNVLKEDWPSDNRFINCVSYLNSDSGREDADGFGTKLTIGEGNVFYGCVAAYNSDDGWDCFAKAATGPIGVVKLYNCYAFMNGYVLNEAGDGIILGKGNGNGLKMGGESITGPHEVHDSYAFYNKAKGLDSNSGPDVKFYNSISYNNHGYNVALYTSNASNTAFIGQGILSLKDNNLTDVITEEGKTVEAGVTVADSLKGIGTQVAADYQNATTYYWDGSAAKNTSGATLPAAADLFMSVDLDAAISFIDPINNVVERNEDGSVSLGDFLKLKDTVSSDIQDIAPKSLSENLANMTYPFTIDPDYATITPDNIADNTGSNPTSGRDSSRSDDTTTTETNTVNNRTNADGDTLITVTAPDGEVLVDVTLPAETPTSDVVFTDVPEDHWAADAINEMAARGLVKGVDEVNKVYDTDSPVTRGTLATLLFRLSNGKAGYECSFTDVAGDAWYADAVAWAAKTGVVTGRSETIFDGDATITREELALMLYRYAGLLGQGTAQTADITAFMDASSVSSWASAGMNWAVANGIINGVGNETLAPQASATRAQTALMLQRFIALVK